MKQTYIVKKNWRYLGKTYKIRERIVVDDKTPEKFKRMISERMRFRFVVPEGDTRKAMKEERLKIIREAEKRKKAQSELANMESELARLNTELDKFDDETDLIDLGEKKITEEEEGQRIEWESDALSQKETLISQIRKAKIAMGITPEEPEEEPADAIAIEDPADMEYMTEIKQQLLGEQVEAEADNTPDGEGNK